MSLRLVWRLDSHSDTLPSRLLRQGLVIASPMFVSTSMGLISWGPVAGLGVAMLSTRLGATLAVDSIFSLREDLSLLRLAMAGVQQSVWTGELEKAGVNVGIHSKKPLADNL